MRLRELIPVLALLATGCARNVHLEQGPTHRAGKALVAVAPVAMLHEVPGAVRHDPFRDGLNVSNVRLSGGYEVQEDPLGMPVRSKHVEEVAQDAYAAQATAWLDELLGQHLARGRVHHVPAPALTAELLAAPTRRDRRGSHRDDGTDNQSLPRFSLTPAPLPAEALAQLPAGAELVLVPMVVHYYSHNAGWFYGQQWGCGSGARVRAFWALHDAADGRALAWADVGARHLDDFIASPSHVMLQDYLIKAERRANRRLRRTLPR